MKTLIRICHCGKEFSRKSYNILRVEKNGGTCCCSVSRKNSLTNKSRKGTNLKDPIYVGLKRLMRYAKRRNKEFDLTIEHLMNIWLDQKGKCVYSNVDMIISKDRLTNLDPRYNTSR